VLDAHMKPDEIAGSPPGSPRLTIGTRGPLFRPELFDSTLRPSFFFFFFLFLTITVVPNISRKIIPELFEATPLRLPKFTFVCRLVFLWYVVFPSLEIVLGVIPPPRLT